MSYLYLYRKWQNVWRLRDFPENHAFRGINEKNGTARQATDGKRIRRMRFACWVTKATDTCSKYVLIAVPRQQFLLERASCWCNGYKTMQMFMVMVAVIGRLKQRRGYVRQNPLLTFISLFRKLKSLYSFWSIKLNEPYLLYRTFCA